ncbi:MAG: isoprenylcysteine carboxylmethyltransferase family protein [Candidatus Rokubacteria bacterium]|nr:isoprenylcysteine carboxylmethyltransferase family protein [Candidatus Rokubacteria bacterium]
MRMAPTTVRRHLRAGLAGLVLLLGLILLVRVVRHGPAPAGLPYEEWYGNWERVLVATGLLTVFLLTFARPRRKLDWRSAGLYMAFLLSLFTEMFGVPLTIYLLAPFLGLSPRAFGLDESHLWAYLLDRAGLLPLHLGVYLVMVVSTGLIASGVALVALGWQQVYHQRDRLVTTGLYAWLRHPQYLGLILIVLAFNMQWPTLPTLLMAPVLIVMYVRQARREDEELAARFGPAFQEYAARVPGFWPWQPRAVAKMPADEPGGGGAWVDGRRRSASPDEGDGAS